MRDLFKKDVTSVSCKKRVGEERVKANRDATRWRVAYAQVHMGEVLGAHISNGGSSTRRRCCR